MKLTHYPGHGVQVRHQKTVAQHSSEPLSRVIILTSAPMLEMTQVAEAYEAIQHPVGGPVAQVRLEAG